MKVLGLSSSFRGGKISEDKMKDIVLSQKTFDDMVETIYELGNSKRICNSEALLLSAMFGAKEEGVDIKIVHLTKKWNLDINDFDGVIVSTPVYYGDRSSYANDFIRYFGSGETVFDKKVAGVVSVGAKRNGGQETTNIYMLNDFLSRGALITGNGPPTAQYGGTGWAGNLGSIIDDDFGLKTSMGTGRQVAKFTKILLDQTKMDIDTNILFLVTKSDKKKEFVKMLMRKFHDDNILDITDYKIERCLACPVCPNGNIDDEYTCAIKEDKDDMVYIHKQILNSDCLVIASYRGPDETEDMFQTFLERSRFIRRNHFELSDRPYSYFGITNNHMDLLHLRVMSSFLRHNMITTGPFYRLFAPEGFSNTTEAIQNISLDDYKKNLKRISYKTKLYRMSHLIESKYIPVGYEDAEHGKETAYRD